MPITTAVPITTAHPTDSRIPRRLLLSTAALSVPVLAAAVIAPNASGAAAAPAPIGSRSLELRRFHISEPGAHIDRGEFFDLEFEVENESDRHDSGILVPAGTTVRIVGLPPRSSFAVVARSNPQWVLSLFSAAGGLGALQAVLTAPLPTRHSRNGVRIRCQRAPQDPTPKSTYRCVATVGHPLVVLPGAHHATTSRTESFRYGR